jgi:hypothetical protein
MKKFILALLDYHRYWYSVDPYQMVLLYSSYLLIFVLIIWSNL